MGYFTESYTPSFVKDALPEETEKEFNQRIRLETNARNEKVQAEWGKPQVVYVEAPAPEVDKEAIIAEYIAEEKARKAAERKARAEAKKDSQ